MSEINALLAEMKKRFNPAAAEGMDATFQYDITDNGSWQIAINNGECEVTEGDAAEASVTLSMDKDVLASVLSGETDGMQAFMSGSITASGDIMLATRLTDLFPLSRG
ncbi:MAG: SCP2 sterol-binding domain-containing protein [Gammaproteobacteria bacterium]